MDPSFEDNAQFDNRIHMDHQASVGFIQTDFAFIACAIQLSKHVYLHYHFHTDRV